jgi:peptide chain release factor subunit 1
MQANDVTPERLRRLAGVRTGPAKVLSLFVNLDPREFATAPARDTELHSVLDRATRLAREAEGLSHAERESLNQDLERLRSELDGGGLDAKGAHGLAVFAASAAGLFEVLKLSRPVDHDPVIDDAPFLEPIAGLVDGGRWCVLLANRRTARLFSGTAAALDEVERFDDDVHGQHDQGGWSQARYQRSVEKEVADHLRHVAEVTFARVGQPPPEGLLVGAPQELVGYLEARLHPYLRERLAGRLEIDVEHTSAEEVRRAAAERIAAAARARQDAALGRLAEAFGTGGPSASGLVDVLEAVHEQRVGELLVDDGFTARGVVCPTCGWLGPPPASTCPAEGSATDPREDIVSVAIARAVSQSANVLVLRDRPELASHGHIAAVLRF